MNEVADTNQLDQVRRAALVVGVAGAVLCVVAAAFDVRQLLQSYLVGYLFWWSMSLGCLGLLMLHNLVAGGWGNGVRAYWRAALGTIPLMALLFLPIALQLKWIYSWAAGSGAGAALSAEKLQYLNERFFWSRAAGYFAVWLLLAWMMGRRKWSFVQHVTPAVRGWSAVGLVLMVLTITFAAVDWVMSLEPQWYSTIFGGLFVADAGLAALLLSIACASRLELAGSGDNEQENEQEKTQCLHDLANLLLAFVMLWTYFAFSQYLIIWAGNLPEESGWYLKRLQGGWPWLALAVAALHFALPFVLLFSREIKRSPRAMFRLALLLLAARFADLFWTVQPSFHTEIIVFPWVDIAVVAGVGGIWVTVFCASLPRCR